MTKRKTIREGLFSFDAGNGTVQGLSSERNGLIEFEPIIAPITSKRALEEADERPRYSLQIDGVTYVFGVDDVFEHGQRDKRRRLNSLERVADADYFMLLDVLFLEAFKHHRGGHDWLSPQGAISLPIELYNNEDTVQEIKETLTGTREIVDYDNCILPLKIEPDRLTILPESAGAMFHYAFEPGTLKKRKGAAVAGVTVVVDVGYLTTDVSLFEGMKYIRDGGFTIQAGLGTVARRLTEEARRVVRGADSSRVDVAMRAVAGARPGEKKLIEVAPGQMWDAAEVYDDEIYQLGKRIVDAVMSEFSDGANRVLLAGGGAYHLRGVMSQLMHLGEIVEPPSPERANVDGAYTGLLLKNEKGK